MSAIWGIINTCKSSLDEGDSLQFQKQYHSYKIDRSDYVSAGNVFFGCCHQYITPTSKKEVLPIQDIKNQILFTADCVIDNRAELLMLFSQCSSETPDGQLLYLAYLQWGQNIGAHVLGAYSFAAYHITENKLVLATDHMANRSLFYTQSKDCIYFSTAIQPLAKVIHSQISEKWLTGCLSNNSADMLIYENITPYQNIYQQKNATIITFINQKKYEYCYWNPQKIKSWKFHPNTDYRNLLIDTLTKSIESMLISEEHTGCTLSSGLDSSTIACLAAPLLAKEGKKLYSYTSVPLKEFTYEGDFYSIFDESAGVRLIADKYRNIETNFIECTNQDAFSELSQLVPLIGYPMKSGQNLTWLNEIYTEARKQHCTIILKGQFGNSTISYGTALSTIYQQLSHLHVSRAFHYACGFSRVNKISRKQILHHFVLELKEKIIGTRYVPNDSILSGELLKKEKISGTITRIQHKGGGGPMDSRMQRLRFLSDPYSLMQLGMFDTIMGLLHGIIIRDPSKDKRVVELCCQLPVECGLAGYLERGMIRTYMQGIVPAEILIDTEHRGLQSADYIYRCRKNWSSHKEKVFQVLTASSIEQYLEPEKYQTLLHHLKHYEPEQLSDEEIRTINVLYSGALFLMNSKGDS